MNGFGPMPHKLSAAAACISIASLCFVGTPEPQWPQPSHVSSIKGWSSVSGMLARCTADRVVAIFHGSSE